MIYLFFLYYNIDNRDLAISLYKQGIQELEKAVTLPVDPNGKNKIENVFFVSFIWIIDNHAVELHTKMRKHLSMARERVDALRKVILYLYTKLDRMFSREVNSKRSPSAN